MYPKSYSISAFHCSKSQACVQLKCRAKRCLCNDAIVFQLRTQRVSTNGTLETKRLFERSLNVSISYAHRRFTKEYCFKISHGESARSIYF